jgi:hypothetical protein
MSLEAVPRAGRYARGTDNASHKLHNDDVVKIRELHAAGETLAALGKQYDVSATVVSQIVTGKRWRHVGGPIRSSRSYTRKKH